MFVGLIVMSLILSLYIYIFFFIGFIRGDGWPQHKYLEHNIYNYLDFIIYLKNKPTSEMNKIEEYAYMNMNSYKIIPI